MRTSSTRRAQALAHLFNLLAALYLAAIAVAGLVQLRWYHQLTVAGAARRHQWAAASSYLGFAILLVAALLLGSLFVGHLLSSGASGFRRRRSGPRVGAEEVEQVEVEPPPPPPQDIDRKRSAARQHAGGSGGGLLFEADAQKVGRQPCCSSLLHLCTCFWLLVVLVVWQMNSGELVRDSIGGHLEEALRRYQHFNRTNYYSVTVDGMQDVNRCCGALDYTDFPRRGSSGLGSGHYPGSCCGKSIFGANARVLCNADEVQHSRQTTGCVLTLANYYDLLSILIVPVALICLFVNVVLIALLATVKVHTTPTAGTGNALGTRPPSHQDTTTFQEAPVVEGQQAD